MLYMSLYLAFKSQTLYIVGFIINQMTYSSVVLLCFIDKTFVLTVLILI